MSNISLRIETITIPSDPTTGRGQIDTPLSRRRASGGSDPLSTPQRAAAIGDTVPIVFGRRVDGAGGVLVSPPATEARFSNDSSNAVTASYLLVISEGQINGIQVRDVFQQSCRVGSFTQAFDGRAGDWGPGNFITVQTGYEDQVPDCPIYCGSGTGSYAGMTTGSFINTIPNGFSQWDRQVHVFVRGGMHVTRQLISGTGPSNNVVDLFRWALSRTSRVPAALIDTTSLLEAARFTNANGLWFNGIISDPSNLADWMGDHLQYFLLRESRRNGRKGLRPLLPFNATTGAISTDPVSWVRTFNEDSIIPGSLNITYVGRADRMPFCAQMVWRQQPDTGLGLSRTAEVRYGGSALDGPYEQHDLSGFATTENHAFKVGAYIIARRRHIEHRLTCKVRPGDVRDLLAQGDIVRLRLRRVVSVGVNTVHDYLYEVDRIARTANGEVMLELTHFPVDADRRSLVALDVVAAVGNGLMLPTGRAAVDCDLNDDTDTTVPTDPGPWEEWDIEITDPPIYDLDDPTEWPDGVEIDMDTGWGPGPVESISDVISEPGWGGDWEWDPVDGGWDYVGDPDWEWDPVEEEWDYVGDPDWEWDPVEEEWDYVGDEEPVPAPPDGPPDWVWDRENQEWDYVGDEEPVPAPPDGPPDGPPDSNPTENWTEGDTGGDGGGDEGGGDAYTTVVGFTEPLVVYPDTFYEVLNPAFATVLFQVTVDAPPIRGPLVLTLTDGFDSFSAVIPEGATESGEIAWNGYGAFAFIGGCTTRTISVTNARGGGYVAQDADYSDPDNPIEFVPAIDLTATQEFEICGYAGTVTWGELGIWRFDGSGWIWAGNAEESE